MKQWRGVEAWREPEGDDATAWGPPAGAPALLPKSALERRAPPGVTPREEEPEMTDLIAPSREVI